MDFREIFSDALVFPLNNIVSLIVYVILGIIGGIAVAGSLAGIMLGMTSNSIITILGSGFLGFVVALILMFIISGYELDIVKSGIERSSEGPKIEPFRQFFNGVKLFVVSLVYYLIPLIIIAILSIFFRDWLIGLLSFILIVLFALAQFMAQCRLAKTEDLANALSVGEAIGDISRVGFVNLLLFVIISVIITVILTLIVSLISQWNNYVGGVLMGILGVYLVFVIGRASGLLYSEV